MKEKFKLVATGVALGVILSQLFVYFEVESLWRGNLDLQIKSQNIISPTEVKKYDYNMIFLYKWFEKFTFCVILIIKLRISDNVLPSSGLSCNTRLS